MTLDDNAILNKTAAGRDEISKRQHGLSVRQRALLISINGELSVNALRQRFAGGQGEAFNDLVGLLLQQGLVEGPRMGSPAASSGVDAPLTRAGEGLDWRRMQAKAGELLHEIMGPEADLLAMKLERARSEADFLEQFERSFGVVSSARGESTAVRYRLGVLAG